MSSHDYTGCQDPACDSCSAHGEGYAAGKAKGLFECAIAVGHMSVTPECRCSPCVGLRYAMFTMAKATPGPSAPEPERGQCVGCGKEGMGIEFGTPTLPSKVCSKCWA